MGKLDAAEESESSSALVPRESEMTNMYIDDPRQRAFLDNPDALEVRTLHYIIQRSNDVIRRIMFPRASLRELLVTSKKRQYLDPQLGCGRWHSEPNDDFRSLAIYVTHHVYLQPVPVCRFG